MLADQDRIFTNLYGLQSPFLDGAKVRGDWDGTAALIALGDNDPKWESEYQKLGTTADAYDDWHEGRDPAGITTQDPELFGRFDPIRPLRRRVLAPGPRPWPLH